MKKTRRLLCLLLALILLVPALSGCQKKAKQPECPFTSIKWGDTLDDVIALEGTSNDTYDSIYKGTTYTYAKEYDGLKGTVKYMFDDHEKLVAMAWTYTAEDMDDLKAVYKDLHKKAEKMTGEKGGKSDKPDMIGLGDTWYLDGGNITLTSIAANGFNAVQLSFLHEDVSEEAK